MTTVAEKVASTLSRIGVRFVFGVPSGNWVDYLAAIEKTDGLEFVLVSNEGSAGFMADVCWRMTGRPAACFGTFGPGACNLSTGVCCGRLDRSPMIAFSDEMSDTMLHRTTQMNMDHQAFFAPITKWTTRLDPDRVEEILFEAERRALSEVPGPVHIGLPADGMGLREAGQENVERRKPDPIPAPGKDELTKMTEVFARSEKPVVALGITATRAGVRDKILALLERYHVPAVLTPMAKGMVPEGHPCYAGVLAHALADEVGKTHQQADLVVGVGYDPVEINYEDWIPEVPVLHLDTAPADLDLDRHRLACDVVGDLSASLDTLLALDVPARGWDLDALAERRAAMFEKLRAPANAFDPRSVLDGLREALPQDGVMTCDVGAHLHLIGQHWRTPAPELQLMTNGCSSMGYAIPSAIAVKLCRPDREVCGVTGDGGFLMMVGEMATAMRLGKRIVFVLMTDANLSLIRIKQEKKGNPRYGTRLHGDGYDSATTFFGVPVYPARTEREYKEALSQAFSGDGPAIVEAFVDSNAYDSLILRGNR